jgi:hypothetical protein
MAVIAGVGSRVGVSVNAGVAVNVGEGRGVGEYAATVCVNIIDANSTDLVPITSTVGVGTACGAQAASRVTIKIHKSENRRFILTSCWEMDFSCYDRHKYIKSSWNLSAAGIALVTLQK